MAAQDLSGRGSSQVLARRWRPLRQLGGSPGLGSDLHTQLGESRLSWSPWDQGSFTQGRLVETGALQCPEYADGQESASYTARLSWRGSAMALRGWARSPVATLGEERQRVSGQRPHLSMSVRRLSGAQLFLWPQAAKARTLCQSNNGVGSDGPPTCRGAGRPLQRKDKNSLKLRKDMPRRPLGPAPARRNKRLPSGPRRDGILELAGTGCELAAQSPPPKTAEELRPPQKYDVGEITISNPIIVAFNLTGLLLQLLDLDVLTSKISVNSIYLWALYFTSVGDSGKLKYRFSHIPVYHFIHRQPSLHYLISPISGTLVTYDDGLYYLRQFYMVQ